MRIAVVVSLTVAPLLAWPALEGAAQQQPMSDDQLIANAMSAAPEAVAKNATVVTVDENGQLKTLKEGSNNFTCFPDDPSNPANDPMCVDENGLEWAKAWINKTEPPQGKIGFGYMLQGGSTPSNVDPHASESPQGTDYMQEPNAFGEKAVLELMDGAMIRAAERWRGLPVTDLERRQLEAVQAEVDDEYHATIGRPTASAPAQVSSNSGALTLALCAAEQASSGGGGRFAAWVVALPDALASNNAIFLVRAI